VLGFSLPQMQQASVVDSRTQLFWKTSVAGALVTRALSMRLGRPEPADDLMAALLRGLGELMLRRVFPRQYAAIDRCPLEEWAQRQCQLEVEHLGCDHAEVGAYVLRRWRLPEQMTEAIRFHRKPVEAFSSSRAIVDRAFLLYFATRTAHLQLGLVPDTVLAELQGLAGDRFGMAPEQLDDFLRPVHQDVLRFAGLLEEDRGPGKSYAAVLAAALEQLMKLSVEISIDHLRIQKEKDQTEQEAARRRREAVSDHLTGIYNRAFLDEMLRAEFSRAKRRMTPVGLLFIDLDGFKPINDRFGHLFGDQVLKEVARLLENNVRAGDTVARYGGDEFCIIAADCGERGLEALANRILEAINQLSVRQGDAEGRIGVSIGAAVCSPHLNAMSPEELLAAADQAMYSAKEAGKNRLCVAGFDLAGRSA
jgi:diguanylate cyclase (GGDEF)-like protein